MSESLDVDAEDTRPSGTGADTTRSAAAEQVSSEQENSEQVGLEQVGLEPMAPPQRRSRGLRVRTLVFGLLLGLVSMTVLVSELSGDQVDGGAIAIVALIGAGVILLAGAVGAAGRAEA